MNHHSRKLTRRMLHSMKRYIEGTVDKLGLLEDLTGTISALEEEEVKEETKFLIYEVEHALWMMDEAEARAFLKEWLSRLEKLWG